jgi:hypothetical protein
MGSRRQKAWILGSCLVAAVVFATAVAEALLKNPNAPANENLGSQPPGPISIAPRYLDFGEVVSRDDFKWTVRLQNSTDDQVDIFSFESSCSCTSVQPKQLVIEPQASREIVLSLDLTPHDPSECSAQGRKFQVTLTPHIRGWSGQSNEFSIRGRARDLIRCSAAGVSLSAVRGATNEAATVQLIPLTKLRRISAECDPAYANVTIAGFDQRVDQLTAASLRIMPGSNLAAGSFSFPVTLRVFASDEHLESQTVRVLVFGRAIDDVIAIPPAVSLGQVRIGETKMEVVSLLSQSGRPFRVVTVDPDPKTASVTIAPIDRGSAPHRFAVSQKAKMLGAKLARARFQISYDGSDKVILVDLPVSYYGCPQNADPSGSHVSSGEKWGNTQVSSRRN